MKRHAAVMALTVLLLAGCGHMVATPEPAETPEPSVPQDPTPSASAGLLVGVGMVLDDGDGPQFCLGGFDASLPPQCGGPPLVGWTWPEKGVERARGTTWGSFAVVGTWDGKAFTVEKTVDPDEIRSSDPADEPDFSTPCPEPAGGWQAPDPARATQEHQDRAFRTAEQLPGYGGSWVDNLGARTEGPHPIVINVRVTKDLAQAERALRTVWGGPLCVSKAETTFAMLRKIQEEVSGVPGSLGSGAGPGRVALAVIFDDGTLQSQMDTKYGPGLVAVSSALQPYPP